MMEPAIAMTTQRGFGKVQPPPKVSEGSKKRAAAGQQLETMRKEGVPEFEIYLRIQGKKNWYPVGAIAVKRSSLVNHAIYDNEQQLREGAFRLFPLLKKNQANLEYGYRLKEFKDEDIKVAEKPTSKAPGFLKNAVQGLTALVKRK